MMPAFKSFVRAAFVALGALAAANSLAAASDVPALVISGKIKGDQSRTLSLAQVEAIGAVELRTSTPWQKGIQSFTGVPMDKLIEAIGAQGKTLKVAALNNYQTEIPVSDFANHRAVLAFKRNGQYMPVRDKGPFFIVFDYDGDPDVQNEAFFAKSAWQVASITVE